MLDAAIWVASEGPSFEANSMREIQYHSNESRVSGNGVMGPTVLKGRVEVEEEEEDDDGEDDDDVDGVIDSDSEGEELVRGESTVREERMDMKCLSHTICCMYEIVLDVSGSAASKCGNVAKEIVALAL